MLETLNEIDWDSMGYPQVPELVRQLMNGNHKEIVEAHIKLNEEIAMGGTDWEMFDLGFGISKVLKNDAQILLIPFLLDILKREEAPGEAKRGILYALSTMLFYTQMEDEGDIYKERALKVNNAIWQGLDIYLDLLAHPNLEVRKNSYSLLGGATGDVASRIYNSICQRFHPPLE